MKNIMAGESSSVVQGVPTFEYIPADKKFPTLFEFSLPLEDLGDMLLKEFNGKTITVRQIYETHCVGKPYVNKNYKDVLRKLEADKIICAVPPAEKRPKRNNEVTFSDQVLVTFP
jgi:hypothetical protein